MDSIAALKGAPKSSRTRWAIGARQRGPSVTQLGMCPVRQSNHAPRAATTTANTMNQCSGDMGRPASRTSLEGALDAADLAGLLLDLGVDLLAEDLEASERDQRDHAHEDDVCLLYTSDAAD